MMGYEFGNQMFMLSGSIMIIAGVALYFAFEIWQNLRDSDPVFTAAPPVAISLGIACLTNGLVLGYHEMMSTPMMVILSLIMITSLVWCLFALGTLLKAVYGEREHA
jgi:hypothetical protein